MGHANSLSQTVKPATASVADDDSNYDQLRSLMNEIRVKAQHLYDDLVDLRAKRAAMHGKNMDRDGGLWDRYADVHKIFGDIRAVLSSNSEDSEYFGQSVDYIEKNLWKEAFDEPRKLTDLRKVDLDKALTYAHHVVHEAHLFILMITSLNIKGSELFFDEYRHLRTEIHKRIELQHQIINYTLVAFAALLGVAFGLKSQITSGSPGQALTLIVPVLLIYPMLALCLAIAWVHNSSHIMEIGHYVQRLEQRARYYGWERFRDHQINTGTFPFLSNSHIVFMVIFLGTQIITMIIALIGSSVNNELHTLIAVPPAAPHDPTDPSNLNLALFLVDIAAIIATFYVLLYRQYRMFRSRVVRLLSR